MRPQLGILGAQFRTVQTDIGLLNGQITPVAKQDGNRYAIIFSNNTSATAVIQFGSGNIAVTGTRVYFQTGPLMLTFNELGGLVQEAMFATCDVPSTTLNVVEVFWIPQTSPNDEVNR